MLSTKTLNVIRWAAVAAGLALIIAQFALGEVPPALAYHCSSCSAGGHLRQGVQVVGGLQARPEPQPRRRTPDVIITVVMLLVVGVVGFFFIRS
jgi:hypothetical protein